MTPDSLQTLLMLCAGRVIETEQVSLLDWEEIIPFAKWNRLGPLLYYHLKAGNQLQLVPDDKQQELLKLFQQATFLSLHQETVFIRVMNLLNEAKIRVMVLKGMALSRLVYPNQACKPMVDIDLLVEPDCIIEAYGIVKGIGSKGTNTFASKFREEIHQHLTPVSIEKVVFELHKHISPSYIKGYIPVQSLWEAPEYVNIGPIGCYVLEKEYFLYSLLDHYARHAAKGHVRLIWLFDIFYYIQQFNDTLRWDRFQNIITEHKPEEIFYNGLILLNHYFGLETGLTLPVDLKEISVTFDRKILVMCSPYNMNEDIAAFRFMKGLSFFEKMKFISSKLFPSRELMKGKYGISNNERVLLYYPLMYYRFFTKGLERLFQKVKRGGNSW